MKGLLPKVAYGLLAILIVAAILIGIGKRETNARPVASSFNPSGLHALQELLDRNGIPTVVSRLRQPQLGEKDLVIAAYLEDGPTVFGENPLEPLEKYLVKFIKQGGRVLVLPFESDFRKRSQQALKGPTPIVNPREKETLQISTSPITYANLSFYNSGATSSSANFLSFEYEDLSYAPWFKRSVDSNEPFLAMSSIGSGILARTADGLFATNRFLDREDNAKFALKTIQGLLPNGGRVVFAEATLGSGIEPSLVSTLGPWATGVWMQLIVLFGVIVFTLGIRFGLPMVERKSQMGQREMIDAISDVYNRARSTAVALDAAYQNADYRIRRSLKLPAHLAIEERNRLLPPTLENVLAQVDLGRKPIVEVDKKGRQKVSYRFDPENALQLMKRLESELDAFIPKAGNRLS